MSTAPAGTRATRTSGHLRGTSELRAAFALSLAGMYGREVPAYPELVEVASAVNDDVLSRDGAHAERLGSTARITAERHGAIRVGTPAELAQVARLFAAFGMEPVGFYDLRDAPGAPVPVVSTAFRPVDPDQLARNPFRVFTSVLVTGDRRFFDADLQSRLEERLSRRRLFAPELLSLADLAAAEGGLPGPDAQLLVRLATEAFQLSTEPVDRAWYDELTAVSPVAADIGGVPTTHINHLTPRVLDIDDLYSRMTDRGVAMIPEIQGPPDWAGPDVLLRQTSFRALAEPRRFADADGSVSAGELRVRFGEVEARGIALTPRGRDLYDRMTVEVDAGVAAGGTRPEVAAKVWERHLPATESELESRGLGWFTYRVADADAGGVTVTGDLAALVASGAVIAEPVVYEDFLPRSAAGIFASNIDGPSADTHARDGVELDIDWVSGVLGREVHDPAHLCARQVRASVDAVAATLARDPASLTAPV